MSLCYLDSLREYCDPSCCSCCALGKMKRFLEGDVEPLRESDGIVVYCCDLLRFHQTDVQVDGEEVGEERVGWDYEEGGEDERAHALL